MKKYSINGYYIPIALAPEKFEHGVHALRDLGFAGVNVTLPNKVAALALSDELTPRAEIIGAVNTISFGADGRFYGDNTDGYGFYQNLIQGAPGWSARSGPSMVFGAGGAARAVVAALLEGGAPEVRISNRTRARADMLLRHFGPRLTVIDWRDAGEALVDATTIVNTTSMGMKGQPELDVSLEGARPDAVVTDIVYTPLTTGFLASAEATGLRTVDGLGMLLQQAAPGFERWFGRLPEVDATLRDVVLGS